MNPIIDPITIYWIEKLDVFSGVSGFLGFVALCGAIGAFIAAYPVDSYCVRDKPKEKLKNYFNLGKWLTALTLAMAIVLCFVPNTETGYKMLLAKYATPHNIEAVKKEIIDIKNGVKQDVIDIIKAAKPEEKGEKK